MHADPPCGSYLFAGRALWGTNLYGPWPLPSTGNKSELQVFTTNRDGPGVTPMPIGTPDVALALTAHPISFFRRAARDSLV
jgi:hypothetical protein